MTRALMVRWSGRVAVVAVIGVIYFLVFPEDLGPVTTAVEGVVHLIAAVLSVTTAIPLGLYIFGASGILGWTAYQVYVAREANRAAPQAMHNPPV